MNVIHYDQMVCASSQKSIVSGASGFGVRTKSNGIPNAEAEELYLKSGVNYLLPVSMMATMESIESHPQMEDFYPCQFTYKSVKLRSGEVYYIVARTFYVGIEYGYFARTQSDCRAGSNYIAHLLVFRDQPPVWVVAAALEQRLFLPHNTICTPDNEEICRLLLGEPIVLDTGELDKIYPAPVWGIEAAWLTIALMQAYKNIKMGAEIKSIIFMVNHEHTKNLLTIFGELPVQLTQNVYFQANTLLFSAVPEGLQMIWVNEKSTIPVEDENHITVNLLLLEPRICNVERNYLFDKILECSQNGDAETLQKIVLLFVGLNFDENPDYEFAYKLMILAQTQQKLKIDELSQGMLDKLLNYNLPAQDTIVTWKKINEVINETLKLHANVDDISNALDAIWVLKKNAPQELNIEETICQAFMDYLFETPEHFCELLGSNTERMEVTLMIADKVKDYKCPEDVFFRSLQTSIIPDLWERFIQFYYGKEQLPQYISQIIEQISKSGIEDKADIANRLFPIDSYFYDWLAEIEAVPNYANIFGSLLFNYFVDHLPTKAEEVITNLIKIPKETAQAIGSDAIIAKYMDYLEKSQVPIKPQILKEIQGCLVLSPQVNLRVNQVVDVLEGNEPRKVDTRLMGLITKLVKKKNYIKKAFLIWLDSSPDANDIINFFADSDANVGDVAFYLDTVWKKTPKKQRTRHILQITDQMSSIGISVKQVRSKIKTDELRDMLKKQNTFIRKIIRKCKSFFFQNAI